MQKITHTVLKVVRGRPHHLVKVWWSPWRAPEQLTNGQPIQPALIEWELKEKIRIKELKRERKKMKRGRQMETNDSGIPRVVRGAANRLETDYISLALAFFVFPFVSLPLSCQFSPCFKLIWCNGNTSKKSLPCRSIGCTLGLLYTDACPSCLLQGGQAGTHTHSNYALRNQQYLCQNWNNIWHTI